MSFSYTRKINYYETDKMGVVHHSNYIRFLEEARCRWLEELNISMEKLEELGYTIPTLEVNCKYKYHITSGDIITIEPKITEFNGVRMTVTYNVIDKKTEKILKTLHKEKIDMSDSVLVINVNGYVGENTLSEINYAKEKGKPVSYLVI